MTLDEYRRRVEAVREAGRLLAMVTGATPEEETASYEHQIHWALRLADDEAEALAELEADVYARVALWLAGASLRPITDRAAFDRLLALEAGGA